MPKKHAAFLMNKINLFAVVTFLVVPIIWALSIIVEPSHPLLRMFLGGSNRSHFSVGDIIAHVTIAGLLIFLLIRVLTESNIKRKWLRFIPLGMMAYLPIIVGLVIYTIYY